MRVLATNPTDPVYLLIGFENGVVVQWNLQKRAVQRPYLPMKFEFFFLLFFKIIFGFIIFFFKIMIIIPYLPSLPSFSFSFSFSLGRG